MLSAASPDCMNELLTGLFVGGAERPGSQAVGAGGAARTGHKPCRCRPIQAPFSNEGRYTT